MARKADPPVQKSRKKRWFFFFATILLLTCLGWFAPSIVALTSLRTTIARSIFADLKGELHVGGASLSWFSPLVLYDVTIRDEQGRTLLFAPRVESAKTLVELLSDTKHIGHFSFHRPEGHVVFAGPQSNLESVFHAWLYPTSTNTDEGLSVEVDFHDARMKLTDADNGREWLLDKVQFYIDVPSRSAQPLTIKLRGNLEGGSPSASAEVEYVYRFEGHGRGKALAKLHDIPLTLASPLVRRFEPKMRVDGQLDGTMAVAWGSDKASDLKVDGRLRANDLDLTAPWLGPDRVRLSQVDLPCKISKTDDLVSIERAELTCDVGKASARGTVDLSRDLMSALSRPGYEVAADVDVAKLGEMLRNVLALQKDVQLTQGRLKLRVRSEKFASGVAWTGTVESSDLQAVANGQQISWQKPLSITVAAHQAPGASPVIDRLQCVTDFLTLNGSGSLDACTIMAQCDLDKLQTELERFVNLGPIKMGGRGTAEVVVKRKQPGTFVVNGKATVDRFRFSDGKRRWDEPSFEARIDGTAKQTPDQLEIADARLRLDMGRDDVELRWLDSVKDWSQGLAGACEVRVRGDLKRWQNRLQPWLPTLTEWRLSGDGDLAAQLRLQNNGPIDVNRLTFKLRNFHCSNAALDINERSMELATAARWNPTSGFAELRNSTITSQTLAVKLSQATMQPAKDGSMTMDAEGTVLGDLDRLSRWLPKFPQRHLAGNLSGRFRLKATSNFDTNVYLIAQSFRLGPQGSPVWQDPQVQLSGRVIYDTRKDTISLQNLSVDSSQLNGRANGSVADLAGKQQVSVEGQLKYDLAQFQKTLQAYMGSSAKVTGSGVAPFSLHGPFAVAKGDPYRALIGDAAFKMASLEAYGCMFGPADVRVKLADGWLRFAPITGTVNKGRFHLEPSFHLTSTSPDLYLARGTRIEKATITPQMCSSALGYAAPALAGVAEAEGQISLVVEQARIPLGDPKKADISANLTIHSARVSPGPVIRELTALVTTQPNRYIVRPAVVPIRVTNGRVYHKDLELAFPNLVVRTHGSVGMDGSLALVAEMPIPPKWVGNNRISKALANQTIRLPIAGTLQRPQLDRRALRDASADFARKMARDLLREGIRNRLKDLIP